MATAEQKKADGLSSQERNGSSSTVKWQSLSPTEAFKKLQSDTTQGLTQTEAAKRLAQFGPNVLAAAQQRSTISIFLAQFKSLLVALLVGATAIALALGENMEAVAILVVIVLNASIGFFTE